MGVFRRNPPRSAKRAKKSPYKARMSVYKKPPSNDSMYRSPIPRIRGSDFGFPDKLVTNLRYVDTFRLTGNAGVPGSNVFRMNSLFDPDLSGVGHQPMYFDQLCGAAGTGPYLKYRVLGSKITVKYCVENAPATAAANIGPIVVGLQMTTTTGLYGSSLSALLEASGSTWTWLGDKAGGNNVKTLTGTYTPARDLGNDPGDDTVAANYNANPSQQYCAVPWKIDTVGAAVVTCIVQIDYRTEFYDRNEVAQS